MDANLDLIAKLDPKPDYLVASGSLPPGLPKDFFASVAKIAKSLGSKFILDTSGEALKLAANEGVYLLKPNLGELHLLADLDEDTAIDGKRIIEIANQIIDKGNCEVIVVSLGEDGALLVSKEKVEHITAPKINKKSTVGAGDSMVAGMVLCLAQERSLGEMIRYGVACGTAATMNEGTELCKKSDVDSLYDWILTKHPLES